MDLFQPLSVDQNLLPKDGIVNYHGAILSVQAANAFLEQLLSSTPWKRDEAIIQGKHITARREVAWYGDRPFIYSYSNIGRQAIPWTEPLTRLKALVETKAGTPFNSCLLNLYHNGSEGMAWHSDDEKLFGKDTTIASLSFGATRKFMFRHKQSKEVISLILEHGSLLIMRGSTQRYWQHTIPKSKQVVHPRVNLTFRSVIDHS